MNRETAERGFELASLPRERIGPFLILGVSKDANAEAIEARWAQCVLWARQGKTAIPLGDIHWAREVLRNPQSRLEADAASLNTDLASQELKQLARLYQLDGTLPGWMPVDPEPPPPAPANVPDPDKVRDSLPAPDVPMEFPGVARWLDAQAAAAIDPWALAAPIARSSEEPGDD